MAEVVEKVAISPPWYMQWFMPLVEYAARSPWEFLQYMLLILSPFLLISAILSWKLSKQLEQEEKLKKARAKRTANIKASRKTN